jgi:ribonuclease P protein 3
MNVYKLYNRSQDDPLLLYAALYSGMGTKFLSRDLMRGHAFRLQNQSLRLTFRRWQLQHQCQLRYVTEAGKVHLKVSGKDFAFRTKIDYILSLTFVMLLIF